MLSFVQAQVIDITVPEARTVNPGDFVTLVFRLQASEATTVRLEVETKLNWTILREPGEVLLQAGESTPVPLTLQVPDDASATESEVVTLTALSTNDEVSDKVELEVSEKLELNLETPSEVLVSDEEIAVVVQNRGNVQDTITLEWFFAEEAIEKRTFNLEPLSNSIQSFEITNDGVYTIVLSSERGFSLRKTIAAISFGVPEPDPFMLNTKWRASYDSSGSWFASLELEGWLSDYVGISSKVDSRYLRNTFVQLKGDRWALRVGETGSDPFGLSLTAGLGIAAREDAPPWSSAYAFGWQTQDKFGGYFATSYKSELLEAALGAGMQSGDLRAGFNIRATIPEVEGDIGGTILFKENALTLSLKGSGKGLDEDFSGKLQGELRARDLFTEQADFRVKFNYAGEGLTIDTTGILPIGERGDKDWEINFSRYNTEPSASELALRLSASEYSLWARRLDMPRDDLFIRYGYGVIYKPPKFGVGGDFSLEKTSKGQNLSLDGHIEFYAQPRDFDGRLEARYQFSFNQFTTSVGAYWSLTEDALGGNLNGNWNYEGQNIQASAGLAYNYLDSSLWSFNASIGTEFALDFETPEGISNLAGGRQTGFLNGRLHAGDLPIANVEIAIDRYLLITDEQGMFSAELEPGKYAVKINLGTIPITFRLESLAEFEIEIVEKEETTLDLAALATAAIQGKVLQDTDGDGQPDDPAVGVNVRLQLLEDSGASRFIATNGDGSFAVRGLFPGNATLTLVSRPLGSEIVGKDSDEITLVSGQINEVIYLVKPAPVISQTFGSGDLRIRRIEFENDRLRSGTDPRVNVTVQGNPERVTVNIDNNIQELIPEGDRWSGSIDIAPDLSDAPLPYVVTASKGNEQITRNGTLFIDSQAVALEIVITSALKADEEMSISVMTYFTAQTVGVEHPFGEAMELLETDSRLWEGTLKIPKDTEPGVYTLTIFATTRQGNSFEEEVGFRVVP